MRAGFACSARRPPIRLASLLSRPRLLVGGWCLFLFLYGASSGPLYRTEALRAVIGRECLSGHYLYPVLYGEPFLTKPPGHYAAIGLSSAPFGEVTAATARLPSVFAATLAVFLMYELFRRTLGARPALLVALLMPCSVLWLDKVPSAEIDMTLVAWVTAANVLLYYALAAESLGLRSLTLWLGALLCVACGTLTKWTAPAFFYLTAIPLLAWRKQLHLLFGWRHLTAVSVAGVALAAWAFAVVQQVGWDALSETLRKEVAYRFAPKAGKPYPWTELLTYPLAVFAAHLPVSAFALVTLRRSFREGLDERGRLLLQFLHCWAWPNLLFWTLVPNHNVRYALPMSAGLMGLGVMGLWAWRRQPNPPTPFPEKEGGARWLARANDGDGSSPTSSGSPFLSREGGWGVRLLWAFLLLWAVAKVGFVEVVIPRRTAGRDAEVTAAELRRHVPDGVPLYALKLKDEGVTFYYARPVLKWSDPHTLPGGAYALLIRQEWEDRAAFGPLDLVSCMHDQQGDPIYLVRKP